MINIVLLEPEIPQNTGNIARTCACTEVALHLIHPLGFSIDEKQVRRAGLDYWSDLDLTEYSNLKDFLSKVDKGSIFAASTKAQRIYSEVNYPEDVYFIFGKESAGLPEELIKDLGDQSIRIPMGKKSRSLNLSNSVAIITYEALRQRDFPDLKTQGSLHRLRWDS
ncbi:MAG: tRNA (cytidine(34)-2'-O)-methyltransferase [Spirochaetaceae bacterium]|nr:tRNA (cytidine(34)-2'-O)-methyltransferase [Spirochaetaceae bacterium]